MADPPVVSCIRFDHRQAIHLLQHRSITSHKDGSRLQRWAKPTSFHNHQARPLWISLPTKRDSLTQHKTGQPTIRKRPTGEASNTKSLQPPFNLNTAHVYPTRRDNGQPIRDWRPSLRAPSEEWAKKNLLQSLSALPPYSRKPGPYGPTMSVCAKVMSRGVHNIAFSLSPDGFWVSDLGNEPESGLVILRWVQRRAWPEIRGAFTPFIK